MLDPQAKEPALPRENLPLDRTPQVGDSIIKATDTFPIVLSYCTILHLSIKAAASIILTHVYFHCSLPFFPQISWHILLEALSSLSVDVT